MEKLLQFLLTEHAGRKIGTLAGLIIGLSIVIFGFLSTLFLAGCMLVGYIIGKMLDDNYTGLDGLKQIFRRK